MTAPRSPVTKQEWRDEILAARRTLSAAAREESRAQIAAHLHRWVGARARPLTVCAYLPLGSEPLDADLPWSLARAGHRVLVPITTPGTALDWTELTAGGAVATGPFGIAEPVGPRLGTAAIVGADLVLVPALAVDRRGTRLGRGGGFYDRSLAILPPEWDGVLLAVLFDGEFVDALPADPHDIPVGAVATPTAGITTIER